MRPREELQRRGAENVPDEILIAILLRSGIPGKNVTELARELLRRYKGLANLSKATFEELVHNKIKGLGKVKALELSGVAKLLFRRNSRTGAVEVLPREGSGIVLNAALHA